MRGGKRPGAGRKKGQVNKATADIKALAQKYTPDALQTLHSIMKASDSDAARVTAANSLIDRGYGKPAQAHTGADGGPLVIQLVRFANG